MSATVLGHALAALLVAQTPAAQVPTFGAVLADAGVNTRLLDSAEFKRHFNSGAVENALGVFIAAFYDADATAALPDTLRIYVLEKLTREWRVVTVPRKQRTGRTDSIDLGAVMRIRHTKTQVYIDTHASPSAGALFVITRDLRPVTTLRGWSLALLADEVLLYHRNMVHFAPTHTAEVWKYDPRTRSDMALAPLRPPDSIRERYVKLVRTIYSLAGEEWFRKNNHHMDPERFNSVLRDTIVVSESGRTFAGLFVWGGGSGPAATPMMEIALHCRAPEGAAFRCIEEELSAARQRFPGLTNDQLLLKLVQT